MNWFTPQIKNEISGECSAYKFPCSKVVCVGRNYVAHAKELNNPIPKEPLLFIKPNTTLSPLSSSIQLDSDLSNCHHELEVAILIGETLTAADKTSVEQSIAGIGIGLDLTLRDKQTELKSKGHPWERAKAFDGSCPMSSFMTWKDNIELDNIAFSMKKNGQIAQQGNTKDLIFPIISLIAKISHHFTLLPGDIILTGTPEGVGPLLPGDKLDFEFMGQAWENTLVISK